MTQSKYDPATNTVMPTDLSHEILTAFFNGVNDTHNKLAMRNGINRLAVARGEPVQRIGESVVDYLTRVMNLTRMSR